MEKTIEFWVCINEDGDFVLDQNSASEAVGTAYEEIGGEALRTVQVALTLTLPEVTEVEAAAPDEDTSASVKLD